MTIQTAKKAVHRISIILALIGLLIPAGQCPAFPYRPAAPLSIVSEYGDFRSSAPPQTQIWKVVAENGSNGAAILRFFLEKPDQGVALCEIALPAPGIAGEIQWAGIGRSGQKKSGTGLLLAPGFPAPCDILPVGLGDGSEVYEETTEAGGRVFSKSYRMSFDAFSVSEARSRGWIRIQNPGQTGLVMVAVTDANGRPVVRQLWPVDGSWWLYEETPMRRSWLMD